MSRHGLQRPLAQDGARQGVEDRMLPRVLRLRPAHVPAPTPPTLRRCRVSALKWTSGPWGVRPDIGAPVGCLKIAHPDWPRGHTDALVAAVYGYKHEQEANAHLIAASPDLYAALEAAVACLVEGEKVFFSEGIGPDTEPVLARARAALAKARGGQS